MSRIKTVDLFNQWLELYPDETPVVIMSVDVNGKTIAVLEQGTHPQQASHSLRQLADQIDKQMITKQEVTKKPHK